MTLEELLILSIVHRCPGIHLACAANGVLATPLSSFSISREAARGAIDDLRKRRSLSCIQTLGGNELRLTAAGGREFRSVLAALQEVANAALTVAVSATEE